MANRVPRVILIVQLCDFVVGGNYCNLFLFESKHWPTRASPTCLCFVVVVLFWPSTLVLLIMSIAWRTTLTNDTVLFLSQLARALANAV